MNRSLAVLVSAMLGTLVSGVGCAGEGALEAADAPGTMFEVSSASSQEILYLTWYGTYGREVSEYALYGDGRLVKRTVDQGNRDVALETTEVDLDREDALSLMNLAVEADLPELTREDLQRRLGDREVDVEDGGTVVVRFHFEAYEVSGEPRKSPFSPTVKMHAPWYQVQRTPELREAQGLVSLIDALEAYFSASEGDS